MRRTGHTIALLAFGSMVAPATQVADALDATLVNMRFIKPLDTELLREIADTHDILVTLEENAVAGGAGSAVNEYLATQGYRARALNLGLPDRFVEHGSREQLLAECGLDVPGIESAIKAHLATLADTTDDRRLVDCQSSATRLIS